MSKRMQCPLSQLRHSNIATVRFTSRAGKKLEIACYKNKVISYRNGTEKNLDDVLQIERVFTDVARGSFASNKLIKEVLGNEFSESSALKYILDHGDLQVSQAERVGEVDEMLKEICTIVSEKCVHATTNRPFPVDFLLNGAKQMGFGVKLDQSVKKQALQFMHQIIEQQPFPIRRAAMLVKCTAVPLENVRVWAAEQQGEITEVDEKTTTMSMTIDPGLFREFDQFCREHGGTVQVVQAAVMVTSVGDAADFDAGELPVPSSSAPLPRASPKPSGAPKSTEKSPVSQAPAKSDADSKAEKRAQRKAARKDKKASPTQQQKKEEEEEKFSSDEEELMMSKKDRNKKSNKKEEQYNNDDDEDEFDYGTEEEEETA